MGKFSFSETSPQASPVSWSDANGLMVGHNLDAWLYRVLPLHSLVWEDPPQLMQAADRVFTLLTELGATSKASTIPGSSLGADYRKFHIVALSWQEEAEIPEGTPKLLSEWLNPVLGRLEVGQRLFAVGVKLRAAGQTSSLGVVENVKRVFDNLKKAALNEDPDPKLWSADRAVVTAILERAGGTVPTSKEINYLESWWNGGRGCEAMVVANPEGKSLSTGAWPEGLEISALIDYEEGDISQLGTLWAARAFGHRSGCVAMSVRGELWPSSVARNHARKIQRRARSGLLEQWETKDIEREEERELADDAKMLEEHYRVSSEPLLKNCSVLFARRATYTTEDYSDYLSAQWGLTIKPVERRQMRALKEMLPCGSDNLANTPPFQQDLTVGFVAAAGLASYSHVGDSKGVWIGLAPPDYSPVWLDPMGSSERDKPPAMAVVGEPGSGKSFFLQLIASQAALAGRTVIFINPKAADSLAGFAQAIGGNVVTLSSMEKESGALDPFRYAEPTSASEIATSHISCVLSGVIDDGEMVRISAGIRAAAEQGCRSVMAALRHAAEHDRIDKRTLSLVEDYALGSSLFRLGAADEDLGPLDAWATSSERGGLILIEFDRPVPVPARVGSISSLESVERAAIAAVRLIVRASLETMFSTRGGVLIVDEAHVFLGSQEGRAALQKLGREGRSQMILPVLATQRIADVIADGADMTSYLGRVMVMKMEDPKEVSAALTICGIEDEEERRKWIARAGPVRGERPSLGLHKDLQGRTSAVMVGPVPDDVHMLFSTNAADREVRDRKLLQSDI